MASAKKVGTVLLDKVDITVVDRYLVKYGLSQEGTPGERVERLVAQQAKVPKSQIGDCDNCHGSSDVREPVCVYCGTGEEEDQLSEAVAANPKATISPTKPKPRLELGDKPAKVSKTIVVDPPVEVLSGGKIMTITAADLDENVAQIHALRKDAVVCYWRLGKAIFANFEGRLYTQRTDGDGSPKYKAFNQFVIAELGLSVSHAYALMDVAVNFSEADVMTVGVAKLTLVARLPPADRGELLDRIRLQNTPLSQVAEEVRRMAGGNRAESAASKGGGKGFSGDVTSGNKAQTASKGSQVTVGMYLGKQTIQMMRKDAPDRQASTIAHDPYCEELHVNGVRTHYRIVKQEEGLALIITRTRESGSETDEPTAKEPKAAKPEKKTKAAKAAKASSLKGKPKSTKKA
jgi:hypothetical protein